MTFDLGDVNALRDMVHAWAPSLPKPMAAQIDRDNLFLPALARHG
jgi:isovaleryl-CoA dehydrogenase